MYIYVCKIRWVVLCVTVNAWEQRNEVSHQALRLGPRGPGRKPGQVGRCLTLSVPTVLYNYVTVHVYAN